MRKVQEKAKHERQNDDCATAKTPQNSSSLNDNAHHIRRRLSQTITSRHCLLIAIALALLSAHACDDTVELQVTCDSAETTWFVPSSNAIKNDTTVTVGSCNDGRVEYVAQVKGNDIDAKGIVLCAQQNENVCYHLKWSSDNLIDVKNCNGYADPICNYICHGGSITRKGEAKQDDADGEPINGNIICDGSTDNAYIYECNGNIIVRKTPCPNGCADDNKGCKQNPDLPDKCTEKDPLICKGEALFDCRNSKYIEGGKLCNDKGEVVFCKENELKQEMHTCEGDQVVWCKPNEQNQLQKTVCYPLSQNDNFVACKDLNKTRRICDENGKILPEESCSNGQTKCADDLKGRVGCNGKIIDACQYCYNESIENQFTTIEKLGCNGCVPNEYNFGDSSESLFNTMNSICHNGKKFDFNKNENSKFLSIPQLKSNGVWEFALNVTLALPKVQPQNPPTDQLPKSLQPTWQYYNCHNDATKRQLNVLNKNQNTKTASVFLSELMSLNKCCDDENSYYITQTGYRYYSVEKCTNIRLHDTNKDKIINTNFSAYAYTPELNGSLIGVEDDLLAKDYACLEVRDNPEDTKAVRRMFIKQQPDGDQQSQDGEPKHGIYKAFECPEKYECELKNPYNGLCIFKKETIAETIKGCGRKFKCNKDTNTISCGNETIAECPKGTKLHIVGDKGVESKCDDQSSFTLDQIRCVPDSQSIAKR